MTISFDGSQRFARPIERLDLPRPEAATKAIDTPQPDEIDIVAIRASDL
jgi:hypothetical protein